MSLVQAVLCDRFVLVCGEQQANFQDGQILHGLRKVYKLNKDVVIGLAGTVEDNFCLFQDYLNQDFTMKEDCRDTLAEVFAKVTERHREMAASQEPLSVFSLVCGWNGYGFEAKTFYLDSAGGEITDIRPMGPEDAKLITCGLQRHYDNFIACQRTHGSSISGLKKAFQNVLSLGLLFDESIDADAQFELIERPEL